MVFRPSPEYVWQCALGNERRLTAKYTNSLQVKTQSPQCEKKGYTGRRVTGSYSPFFVQQLETRKFVEAAGNFYIGFCDQSHDDRKRIHQAE